ncbi:aspartyl-tRNA(Asn)/glutamyl-tRNA(Gln) amidotransferase subunit A [Rhizobium aquaticum]|uniref:Aspartyl-tRNA(Asn)/glutamyl-tRNA(Gln) amidotransferase subunit A n=1 Tax=Rhizobium aquaticum TaxID=1549636 RepID=A0ABV2J2L7_9HYPH
MNVLQPLPHTDVLEPTSFIDPGQADARLSARPSTPVEGEQRVAMPIAAGTLDDISAADVGNLLSAYAEGTLDTVAVLDALTSSIATTRAGGEAVLRFVPGAAEAAKESAARWASGTHRPLEGIPFGVKDIIDVAGTEVTSGSHFTGHRIAPADAHVVARLRAAGAIPFAMTATSEFACGGPHNPRYGAVTNPWDVKRWTGGSSTGSGAALAARLMPLALGTDTGGSIRVPSCWCGTTGLKPTREKVSREGVAALSWTLDHIGPMARSAQDIACVLPFMTATPDRQLAKDCAALFGDFDISGLRIGVPTGWFTDNADQAVLTNWKSALEMLENLGCLLVDLPPIDVRPYHEAGWVVLQSELAALHADRADRADLMDPGMLGRLRKGMAFGAKDYARALQERVTAQETFLSAMENVDLMITPGIGGEAGSLETLTVDVNGTSMSFQDLISRNTMIFDFTGFPALMLPTGLGRAALPTGMQIVGRPHAEALCLRVGAAFQAVTAHHCLVPPGAASD